MASLRVKMSIRDMPEVIYALRHELSQMLRSAAKNESPDVAERLDKVAAAFEAGQSIDA